MRMKSQFLFHISRLTHRTTLGSTKAHGKGKRPGIQKDWSVVKGIHSVSKRAREQITLDRLAPARSF